MKTNGRNKFHEESYEGNSLFKMIFSPKKSKMAIISILEKEDDEPQFVEVVIFDEDMEQDSYHKFTLPIKGHQITFLNPVVLENGDVYIETKERYFEDKKQRHIYVTHRRVYRLKNEAEEVVSYDLKLEDKRIISNRIYINEFGIPLCIGYFIQGKKNWGVFQINLNEIDKEVKLGSFSIDKAKTWYTPDGFLGSDKGPSIISELLPYGHEIRHVMPDGSNGMYLFTEHYSEWSSDNNVNKYRANNIFVSKINQNGEIEWTSIIDKLQESGADDGYRLSFSLHFYEGVAYILYNDGKQKFDKDNRPKDRDKYAQEIELFKEGPFKFPLLLLAKVDLANGNISKYVLHNNKENKLTFIPRSSYYDEESRTVHFFSKKRFSSPVGAFGKIKF